MGKPETLTVYASDVSGQLTVEAADIGADASVGELVQGLLAEMKLPRNDSSGRQLDLSALWAASATVCRVPALPPYPPRDQWHSLGGDV